MALVVALAVPVAASAQADGSGSVDAPAVRSAVHAFHDALAAGDSARAMALLHPDATVLESGHAETREEYRHGHLPADIAFSRSVDRETLAQRVSGRDGWALYESEYRMTGTFRGEAVDVRGAETVLLVLNDAGWRIRHIHWSSR